MISFTIFRTKNGPVSGVDMGDLELVVNGRTVSSRMSPRFQMMIYIALSDLIDGFLKLDKNSTYEFIGPDSSMSLRFVKAKSGIRIFFGKEELGIESLANLRDALLAALEEFLSDPANALQVVDPVYGDFFSSVDNLKKTVGMDRRDLPSKQGTGSIQTSW